VSVPFSARDAADWTGGELLRGSSDAVLSGACIDTRRVSSGDLFIAIVGPTHDAHRFLEDALKGGAAGLMIEKGRALPESAPEETTVIAVDETTAALGELAAGHRSEFSGHLIAITGSNGKTTTKEMCASILEAAGPCLKNEGNLNNQFGLPLTLLRREASHGRVVVEIGMNHRGEIAPLAAIAKPTVGVITNVGTAHIEHLGSREEIALEKGDLIAGLPAGATAVVNGDDALASAQAERTDARVVRFGMGPDADVRAEDVQVREGRGFAFDLCAPEGRAAVQVDGVGDPTVANALAAAAAALAADATLAQVAEGLAAYRTVGGRMQRIDAPGGVVVLNDTYNANPQSMEAALRTLVRVHGTGRALFVAGSMGELGDQAEPAHAELGRHVAASGIDFLFALGEYAPTIAAAATAAGMDRDRVQVGADHADLTARIVEVLEPGDWVLVKGSRAMQMERVVEALAKGER
jgi:UDP-N-acetylmuramoyl-tripeptide--D-alanyl-D-alanine ligase